MRSNYVDEHLILFLQNILKAQSIFFSMNEEHQELMTRKLELEVEKLELEVLDLVVNKGLGKIREQIEKEEEAKEDSQTEHN
jgi:hypothetical protein